MEQLANLFHTFTEMEHPPILELLDINKNTIGALYLDQLRFKKFHISETSNSEKYFLVIDGVGIYFSYYKKITL